MNPAVYKSLLKMAMKLLERWKAIEANEVADENAFAAQWSELGDDVAAFLETCRDAGMPGGE